MYLLLKSNSGSDRSSGDSLPSSVDSAVASTDSTTSINLTMSQDKTEQVEMNNLRQFERQSSNSLQTERQEDTEQSKKFIRKLRYYRNEPFCRVLYMCKRRLNTHKLDIKALS